MIKKEEVPRLIEEESARKQRAAESAVNNAIVACVKSGWSGEVVINMTDFDDVTIDHAMRASHENGWSVKLTRTYCTDNRTSQTVLLVLS